MKLTNWKTTAAGGAAVLGVVVHVLNAVSTGDFSGIGAADITSLIAGVGLLFAKDNNVTGGTVKQ